MSEVFSDNMEEKHSVKFILKELTEVIEWKQDKKIILVDEEEYYKHLLNEVYAFYFRAQTQKKNIDEMLNSQKFDFTWKFGFCCKVFQKIYFSVKLRKKTERTERHITEKHFYKVRSEERRVGKECRSRWS